MNNFTVINWWNERDVNNIYAGQSVIILDVVKHEIEFGAYYACRTILDFCILLFKILHSYYWKIA